MSQNFKLKYEVIAILKENIEKGMAAFGLPVVHKPGDRGWIVMESDQPSFQNADNTVLFYLEKVERIGIQSAHEHFNKEKDKFEVHDNFIEQQTWRIKALCKRTTAPVTDDNIPVLAEDVTSMLVGWFNRLGCEEFRKHNMANLFVQMKDVKTYKDKSDVSQWTSEFPLKIQVLKLFTTEIDWATVKYEGSYGLEGGA